MGRVVTLVKSPGSRVYGVAYEFRVDQVEKLFEYLNFREKCGYSLNEVHFEPTETDAARLPTICYYANEQNPYFSLQTDLHELARQINESIGPSGSNREYLFNLCTAIRAFSTSATLQYDEHLFELEALVNNLSNKNC